MIVVEGPDNSGKSTLIEQLINDFNLKKISSDRHGPPINEEDNANRVKTVLIKAIKHRRNNVIVDRFSLIGEEIYGPILRHKNLWTIAYKEKIKFMRCFKSLNPFIIYCRPPDSFIMDLSKHIIKDYDSPSHIKNIEENQKLIIKAYDNYFAFWDSYNFFKYDYTNPVDYQQLCYRLKEYLKW